jgi:hypothetical protein
MITGCGTHVDTSIKLGIEPGFCAGTNGIIVEADDITIDLNGHLYHGDRTAGTIGIDVASHHNVTIKNGIIQGFGTGIATDDGSDGLKIVNVEIRDSVATGIDVLGSGAVIDKTVVVRNTGPGILFHGAASGAKVSSTFVIGNNGLGLASAAPGMKLKNVTSAGNLDDGIRLNGDGDGTVQGAVASANGGAGVEISGEFGRFVPSSVKKTCAAGNATDGISLEADNAAMTLDSNFAGGNGNAGIVLLNEPDGTLVKKNLLLGNGNTGLFLGPDVTSTSIVQNRAAGNGLVGFEIFAASTLTNNIAVGNGFGISAPLSTDGGGNVAHDNVDEQQCAPPIVCD